MRTLRLQESSCVCWTYWLSEQHCKDRQGQKLADRHLQMQTNKQLRDSRQRALEAENLEQLELTTEIQERLHQCYALVILIATLPIPGTG